MTLASTMGDAERALRLAEAKVEALLTTLFQDWKGWQFHRTHDNRYSIDVFEGASNPIVVRALFAAGFTTVCIHPHKAARFLTCACKVLDAY